MFLPKAIIHPTAFSTCLKTKGPLISCHKGTKGKIEEKLKLLSFKHFFFESTLFWLTGIWENKGGQGAWAGVWYLRDGSISLFKLSEVHFGNGTKPLMQAYLYSIILISEGLFQKCIFEIICMCNRIWMVH